MTHEQQVAYWKTNLRYIIGTLIVWFTVSYLFGIIFSEQLDTTSIGGFPLGFWFAQQGSIYVFIALIFYYTVKMKAIERKYDLDD